MSLDEIFNQVATNRFHPGYVPSDRRDFTVVCDRPERLSTSPSRRGVGAISTVKKDVPRRKVRILKVGVKFADF